MSSVFKCSSQSNMNCFHIVLVCLINLELFNYNNLCYCYENLYLYEENSLWKSLNLINLFNTYLQTMKYYNKTLENIDCIRNIQQFKQSFQNNELWAMKLYDSTSKLHSGILAGNYYNLGNFDECLDVTALTNFTITSKFCQIEIHIPKTLVLNEKDLLNQMENKRITEYDFDNYIIFWSVCLFNSCNVYDIFKDSLNEISTMDISVMISEEICFVRTKLSWTCVQILCGFIIVGLLLLIFIGSLRDYFDIPKGKELNFFNSFSLLRNSQILFHSERNSNHYEWLSCLDGLRSLSCIWIILYHRFDEIQLNPYINLNYFIEWVFSWKSFGIFSGIMAVETFFVIGALLVSYHALRKREKNRFNFIEFVCQRYFRLTSVLIFWLIGNKLLIECFNYGPFWRNISNDIIEPCEKYWWSFLFYIQNYVNVNDMCFEQTWYLNVDMQLYIVSSIFLYIMFYYNWKTVLITLSCTISTLSIFQFYTIAQNRYPAGISIRSSVEIQERDSNIYYPTHAHATSWFIGLATGYILYKFKRISINTFLAKVINFMGCSLLLMVLIGMHCVNSRTYRYNFFLDTFFLTFQRSLWAIGISLIILSCTCRPTGLISSFLCLPCWKFLSKLSFCMYIVHYQWMKIVDGTVRSPEYFGFVQMLYKIIGDICCSILLATILVLFVEYPFKNLYNLIVDNIKLSNVSKFKK